MTHRAHQVGFRPLCRRDQLIEGDRDLVGNFNEALSKLHQDRLFETCRFGGNLAFGSLDNLLDLELGRSQACFAELFQRGTALIDYNGSFKLNVASFKLANDVLQLPEGLLKAQALDRRKR